VYLPLDNTAATYSGHISALLNLFNHNCNLSSCVWLVAFHNQLAAWSFDLLSIEHVQFLSTCRGDKHLFDVVGQNSKNCSTCCSRHVVSTHLLLLGHTGSMDGTLKSTSSPPRRHGLTWLRSWIVVDYHSRHHRWSHNSLTAATVLQGLWTISVGLLHHRTVVPLVPSTISTHHHNTHLLSAQQHTKTRAVLLTCRSGTLH